MKNIGVLSTVALATVLSVACPAHAQTTTFWILRGGQAKSIAVGANNIPWVVGLGGATYYGTFPPCPGPNGSICPDPNTTQGAVQWNSVGGMATSIAVDPAGAPWTLYHGQMSMYHWAGNFWLHTATEVPVPAGAAACISQLAVGEESENTPLVLFPNIDNSNPNATQTFPTFWGIDCSSARNLWRLDADIIQGGQQPWHFGGSWVWSPVDTGDNQVALFSANAGSSVTQNPWITVRGGIWAFNGSGFTQIETPGYVTYLADHFAVTSNGVYYWTGTVYGQGTGDWKKDWTLLVGHPWPFTISQIAYTAATLVGTAHGDVGPSNNLWAIDTYNNIWEAETFLSSPTR